MQMTNLKMQLVNMKKQLKNACLDKRFFLPSPIIFNDSNDFKFKKF